MAETSVRKGRVAREGVAELHAFSSAEVYLVRLLQMSRISSFSLTGETQSLSTKSTLPRR